MNRENKIRPHHFPQMPLNIVHRANSHGGNGQRFQRLLVEVSQGDLTRFGDVMNEPIRVIGTVTEADTLIVPGVEPLAVEDLADAFNGLSQAADTAADEAGGT